MKKAFFTGFVLITGLFARTQTATILMDRCMGDSTRSVLYSVQKTSHGGYILGGFASANNGDVSGFKGMTDAWIVKMNDLGGFEWQLCIGGSNRDLITSVKPTTDGGYIACGTSASFDGDISVTHSSPASVNQDMLVVKLNNLGQIQWLKTFGGSRNDYASQIIQTSDGGFLVAANTQSSDGDVSGFHEYPGQPLPDAWLVKLSSTGDIQWQKCYGGLGEDYSADLVVSSDGNAIFSGVCGHVSGDIPALYGGTDAWVVKVDMRSYNLE